MASFQVLIDIINPFFCKHYLNLPDFLWLVSESKHFNLIIITCNNMLFYAVLVAKHLVGAKSE